MDAPYVMRPKSGRAIEPPSVREDARTVQRFGDGFALTGPFTQLFVEALEAWPRPRPKWNEAQRVFTVGVTLAEVMELVKFARKMGYTWSAEAEAFAMPIMQRAADRMAASELPEVHELPEVDGMGGELRPYQKAAVKFLLDVLKNNPGRGAYEGDDQGLGKTVVGLATVWGLKAFPCIVVAPKNAEDVWINHILGNELLPVPSWTPGKTLAILSGFRPKDADASWRPRGWVDGADFYLTSDTVIAHHVEALRTLNARALIMDEAHYFKNPSAARTRGALALAESVRKGGGAVLPMSGTSMENRTEELKAQIAAIGWMDEFGGSGAFTDRYGKGRNGKELGQRMRALFYVRRLKADVLKELPPKQYTVRQVALSNEVEYRRAEANIAEWLASNGRDPSPAMRAERLVRMTHLRTLVGEGKAAAVVEWAEEFLQEGDEKLVLFAHHKSVIGAMEQHFSERAVYIHGGVGKDARRKAVERFQTDPECRLFVGEIISAGIAITLTAAANAAIAELMWNPAKHAQAEDRIHRFGQTRSVNINYLLATGTIDDDMWVTIREKERLVATVQGDPLAEEKMEQSVMEAVAERLVARRVA